MPRRSRRPRRRPPKGSTCRRTFRAPSSTNRTSAVCSPSARWPRRSSAPADSRSGADDFTAHGTLAGTRPLMPAVFVHGVPDTHRVWHAVVGRLRRRDVVTLSLPGFDCELPTGFDCTKEAYGNWLLAELRRIDGPIDLIGHDWGGLLVVRAVSLEPTLVRTWTAGGAPLDPDYEWHKAAKLWQTPGVGEQVMEKLTPEVLASALVAAGVPQADATTAGEHLDP